MILSGAWNFRMNWNKLHNFSLEKRNNLPASGKSASWSTNWKTSRPLGMLFEMQNWNSFAVGKGSSQQKGGGPMKSHIRSVVTSGNCLTLWSCLFGIQLFLSGTGSFGLARNLHKLQQRQQLQPCVDDVHVVLGQKSWPEEQQGPGPAASPTLIYLSAKCLGLNRSNSLCLPFLFFFFFFGSLPSWARCPQNVCPWHKACSAPPPPPAPLESFFCEASGPNFRAICWSIVGHFRHWPV